MCITDYDRLAKVIVNIISLLLTDPKKPTFILMDAIGTHRTEFSYGEKMFFFCEEDSDYWYEDMQLRLDDGTDDIGQYKWVGFSIHILLDSWNCIT